MAQGTHDRKRGRDHEEEPKERSAFRRGVLVLALAALARRAGGARSKADVVTLNWTLVNTVQNAWEQTIHDLRGEVSEHPDQRDLPRQRELSTLIRTQLQAGNAPDIFTGGAGTGVDRRSDARCRREAARPERAQAGQAHPGLGRRRATAGTSKV